MSLLLLLLWLWSFYYPIYYWIVENLLLSNHCSIQSLLTSGTTHTSKYGIFRSENTVEALGGADGETNLQDSGDDHSDSAHFFADSQGRGRRMTSQCLHWQQ